MGLGPGIFALSLRSHGVSLPFLQQTPQIRDRRAERVLAAPADPPPPLPGAALQPPGLHGGVRPGAEEGRGCSPGAGRRPARPAGRSPARWARPPPPGRPSGRSVGGDGPARPRAAQAPPPTARRAAPTDGVTATAPLPGNGVRAEAPRPRPGASARRLLQTVLFKIYIIIHSYYTREQP